MTDLDTGEPPLPWHEEPYSIKRFGVSILNCASEPIRTPGCIQSHGALLTVQPEDLRVLQVSENSLPILGHDAASLLGQPIDALLG